MRLKVTSVKVKTGLSKALSKASTLSSIKGSMSSIGHKGLGRLINATPSRSGKTKSSWDMEVEKIKMVILCTILTLIRFRMVRPW